MSTILGFLATGGSLLVASVGIVSQIRKNFKTKSCGIDLVYISLIFISYTLWSMYGFSKKDWFIFTPHVFGMIFASIILYQYHKFKVKK